MIWITLVTSTSMCLDQKTCLCCSCCCRAAGYRAWFGRMLCWAPGCSRLPLSNRWSRQPTRWALLQQPARSCSWPFAAESSVTAGYRGAVEGSYLYFGPLTTLCSLSLGTHGRPRGGTGDSTGIHSILRGWRLKSVSLKRPQQHLRSLHKFYSTHQNIRS